MEGLDSEGRSFFDGVGLGGREMAGIETHSSSESSLIALTLFVAVFSATMELSGLEMDCFVDVGDVGRSTLESSE